MQHFGPKRLGGVQEEKTHFPHSTKKLNDAASYRFSLENGWVHVDAVNVDDAQTALGYVFYARR